jgi:hypothetical protein
MSRFRRLAPYFLLGPLTGPCVAGVVINLQRGNRVLAGLYAIAALETVFLLPPIVVALGVKTTGDLFRLLGV